MTDVGSVAVTDDVGGPLVLGGVGVTSTDIAGLQSLEVLESAKFIGHFAWSRSFDRRDREMECTVQGRGLEKVDISGSSREWI